MKAMLNCCSVFKYKRLDEFISLSNVVIHNDLSTSLLYQIKPTNISCILSLSYMLFDNGNLNRCSIGFIFAMA